jgi:hypothetical protein
MNFYFIMWRALLKQLKLREVFCHANWATALCCDWRLIYCGFLLATPHIPSYFAFPLVFIWVIIYYLFGVYSFLFCVPFSIHLGYHLLLIW